jgi:hypothetical protein
MIQRDRKRCGRWIALTPIPGVKRLLLQEAALTMGTLFMRGSGERLNCGRQMPQNFDEVFH